MTTPSKTYTIYFEVNKNNISKICKNTSKSKSFSGYDLGDSTFSTAKGCNSCSKTSSSDSAYPIKGSYTGQPFSANFQPSQSTGTLSLTDFPMPSGSFNRGWSDYKGTDKITYSCPTCGNNDTIMFSASDQYNGYLYNKEHVQKQTCSNGDMTKHAQLQGIEYSSNTSWVNYPYTNPYK